VTSFWLQASKNSAESIVALRGSTVKVSLPRCRQARSNYKMPKKRRTRRQKFPITRQNQPTNQATVVTYSRWFEFYGSYNTKRSFISGKLPGYFTQEYELAYQNRTKDKKKI